MTQSAAVQTQKLFLSYSKISTFNSCPLSYKYRYIDKLPTRPSHYLSFGNSLHSAIEEFQKRFDSNADRRHLVELLEKHWISEGYRENNEDEQKWKEKGLKYLTENFYNWYIEQCKQFEQEKIEERFRIENSTYILTGKIDRIDRNKKTGKYRIIDFKTGKVPRINDLKKDLQLYIYFFSIKHFDISPDQVEAVSYFYLPEKKELSQSLNDSDLILARDKIEKEAGAILSAHQENHFPPRTSRLCDYCDFNHICPAVNGSGKPLPPEESLIELVERYLRMKEELNKKQSELKDLEEKIITQVRKQGGTVIAGGYRISIEYDI